MRHSVLTPPPIVESRPLDGSPDDPRVFMCLNHGCEIELKPIEMTDEHPATAGCDTCGCDFGFRELHPHELLDRMYDERSRRHKAERELRALREKLKDLP